MHPAEQESPDQMPEGNRPTAEDASGRQPSAEELSSRLAQAHRQLDSLRARSKELEQQAQTAGRHNKRLTDLLEVTRREMEELKNALHADGQAPFTFGTVIAHRPGHERIEGREIEAATAEGVDILHSGRKLRVSVSPLIQGAELSAGDEVLLNENFTIVAVLEPERTGELARVKEVLSDDRLVVLIRGEDERVVRLAPAARHAAAQEQTEADRDPAEVTAGFRPIRVGDAVTVDLRTGTAVEVVPLSEVEDVVLEESPEISYADIGGLGEQIEQIRDAVELPFLHAELYREHGLTAPKGILLYGPPGCGKTMIAKAVASSLASTASAGEAAPEVTSAETASTEAGEQSNLEDAAASSAYFLNIKGPELLNKYVGETERHIRVIFSRARERATAGHPVVVFFDEMEALFRTRGAGVSSDVETTIVPQLLAEIDGVESLDNVIVIGASNREDMIDPAILRPGRLDIKIRVQRPSSEGAEEILGIHLGGRLPLRADLVAEQGGRQQALDALIEAVVGRLYPEHADLVSGAVLSNIVDRAKKDAIKDFLASGEDRGAKGLALEHVLAATAAEIVDQQSMAQDVFMEAQEAGR